MRGIYNRSISCTPYIDTNWITLESCVERKRVRRGEVDILQLGVELFVNKAVIKQPNGTLTTVSSSELTITD